MFKKLVCTIDYTNMQSKLTVQSDTVVSSKTNVGVCMHVEVNSRKEKQKAIVEHGSYKHLAAIMVQI